MPLNVNRVMKCIILCTLQHNPQQCACMRIHTRALPLKLMVRLQCNGLTDEGSRELVFQCSGYSASEDEV